VPTRTYGIFKLRYLSCVSFARALGLSNIDVPIFVTHDGNGRRYRRDLPTNNNVFLPVRCGYKNSTAV
jgi:hypothetical protein